MWLPKSITLTRTFHLFPQGCQGPAYTPMLYKVCSWFSQQCHLSLSFWLFDSNSMRKVWWPFETLALSWSPFIIAYGNKSQESFGFQVLSLQGALKKSKFCSFPKDCSLHQLSLVVTILFSNFFLNQLSFHQWKPSWLSAACLQGGPPGNHLSSFPKDSCSLFCQAWL